MRTCFLLGLGFLLSLNEAAVRAQEAATQEASPEASVDTKAIDVELDKFRDDLFHAFNTGDYPTMLEKYCHKDIIATWQDGTTSEGHAGVIAEFDKLKQFIDKMTVDATTDKRLILNDGNLVISSGEMKDHYVLGRGPSVNLNSRWSATLIKDNDRWVLVSFSASTNAFDNEVVSLYLTSQKYTVSAAAGLIGIGIGLLLSRIMNRRSKA
jgi:hypothetical protein